MAIIQIAMLIVTLALLVACYALPSFITSFLSILGYGVITKKRKSPREVLKLALKLTPVLTVVFFVALHGIQFISKPSVPMLDKVSVDSFRLSEYSLSTGRRLQDVLEKLFPPGTSKKYIDGILVDREGAEEFTKVNQSRNVTFTTYRRLAWPWTCFPMSGKTRIRIWAEYDAQLNLIYWSVARSPTNGCDYF